VDASEAASRDRGRRWPAEILIPVALEGATTADNANDVRAKIVIEAGEPRG